jgi:undecaprenyl diphosphate synthase
MPTKITHLGIIMDGNRRWAKEQGLPSFEGHRAGYDKVEEVAQWCQEAGIKYLTLFAFSTENWQRSKEEVSLLMQLLNLAFTRDIEKLHKDNVRVKVIGQWDALSESMQDAIAKAEEMTKNNTGLNLNVAISYGGRQEIVDAVNRILKNPPESIDEAGLSKRMYTAGQPDPDLIIRTSGEQRTSGFLLWQAAYSELYFTPVYWPAFSKKEFDLALDAFDLRERRFGK